MRYTTSNKLRPLNIKFEIYSENEDNKFKCELVSLMRGSVQELQLAAENAFKQRNPEIFKKAAHKAKSTLILLDDHEFFQVVEAFKENLIDFESRSNDAINKLNELCDSISESLEKEADQLRSS
jgi:hypothetical protein